MGDGENLLTSIGIGIGLTAVAVAWVVLLVRVVGLRSLAKMTGFDFITTNAVGSLVATAATATSLTGFAQAMAAIGGLFALQWLLARARIYSTLVQSALSNEPVLLMEHGRFLEKAMKAERVTKADIYGKMREAGVTEVTSVRAVVLERTGDISIIKAGPIDDAILAGVSGAGASAPPG
jgi:uncharacterized membrane protein YcaP (DUF421 family)